VLADREDQGLQAAARRGDHDHHLRPRGAVAHVEPAGPHHLRSARDVRDAHDGPQLVDPQAPHVDGRADHRRAGAVTAYDHLIDDLVAEAGSLDEVVASLDDAGFATPTPAEGWTVADQLGHLAGFDEAATTAIVDPDGFLADLDRRITEGDDPIIAYTE